MSEPYERLQKSRRDAGFSSTESAAEAFGWNKHTYLSHEMGRRGIPATAAKKYALAFRVTPEYILFGRSSSQKVQEDFSGDITVVGDIQAGIWKEAIEYEPNDRFRAHVIIPSKYDAKKCYGLRVGGDSMNLLFPEGYILGICPLWDYPEPLQSGDCVIVHRALKNGATEATVKELEIIDGKALLWPRSSNPKFKEPISISWPYEEAQMKDIETVEIRGVVISAARVFK